MTYDLGNAVGHALGRGRVRCQHFVALPRQVSAVQVHGSTLDPGSADVHAEDLHGTHGTGRPGPLRGYSAERAAASARRSRRSSLGRENVIDSSAVFTVSTSP